MFAITSIATIVVLSLWIVSLLLQLKESKAKKKRLESQLWDLINRFENKKAN